ncbi:ABC transporter ATP-binding protein [Peloplasma aerotolerans]|uniref:ABC transporter ATP-binding protein n=1 Tax=Peloplasma aerotolerans TaxID=3044389 RepID=A0AAW6U2J9_9MOLU|nr:ABC transporter ATP-binding protein [Mariniplasma sp. M4Ah]MDI6452196.1 ABC transporter ATP-binding protein [Mariniplasma sp. M4Ah]
MNDINEKNAGLSIKLENLTKIFTDKRGNETLAVDALNVVIPPGQLVSLLGPSGCGKSTTLYMIAGLLRPSDGKIYFGDNDVTRVSPDKRGIGLVFQNYALYPHMTVRQNILFPLENMNIQREEALKLALEMAELVGISDQLDKKPAELSGGQQQRVAIARALVKKPDVLLLDEPLSNLDARLRLQMREEIKRIQRETGITTIFVTHDQEEAMSISDLMIVLDFGKEQQMDSPQQIYYNPKNMFVAKFLGSPPINTSTAEVINKEIKINGLVLDKTNAKDGKYNIGIRPEDFRIVQNGVFNFKHDEVEIEVIGRDTMIRFNFGGSQVRAIVDSDSILDKDELSIGVKKGKVLLFDIETGRVVV